MLRKHSYLLIILAIAIASIAVLFLKFNSSPVPKPPAEKAFMNVAWGMSMAEVEEAIHAKLTSAEVGTRFYSPKNPLENNAKIKAYEQTELPFLGRKAKVTYIFYRDRLFLYHLFLRDNDAETLDTDVTKYLTREYGPGFTQSEEGSSAKIIWQTKELIVNYWFYRDDLRLREQFSAGFAVIYQPIESGIH